MEESTLQMTELINARSFMAQMPSWQFTDIVVEMLYHYAKQVNLWVIIFFSVHTKN
jgi:hypothetical protein